MKNGECINCGKPLFDQQESYGNLCDDCSSLSKEEMVAKPDKLYIAGTICRGHNLSVLQYIKWKLGKFIMRFLK